MSDDLELLVGFRSEVPTPDEATAERVHRLATKPRPRRRRPLFSGLSGRPRIALTAAVVGLVLVPTALAFGHRILDLFQGTPAPPAISFVFTGQNRFAEMAMRAGFAIQFPHVDVSKAHGVIQIETADGPEELWAAPNDQGGQCSFIDFAEQPPGSSAHNEVTHVAHNSPGAADSTSTVNGLGIGTCDPATPPPSNITLHQFAWTLHPSLVTVTGTVYVDAATVQLTLADGSTTTLPVVERLFLGSFDKRAEVTQVTAYDKAGNRVAHTTP
jgi:hypothetical protein